MAIAPIVAGASSSAFPWSSALQIGGGLAGLFGGKGSRKKADGFRDAAARLLGLRGIGTEAALRSALSYNPGAEDKAAADNAQAQAARTFGNTWQSLGSKFRKLGGDTGGDTRFANQVAGAAGSVFDPLKTWLADQASTRTLRKIGALTQAVSSGSDVTGQYMGLSEEADRNAGNMGDALSLISGGLDRINGGKKAPATKAPRAPVMGTDAAGQAPQSPVDPFNRWKTRFGR